MTKKQVQPVINYLPGSKFFCDGCKRMVLGQGFLTIIPFEQGGKDDGLRPLCLKCYRVLFPKFEEKK